MENNNLQMQSLGEEMFDTSSLQLTCINKSEK